MSLRQFFFALCLLALAVMGGSRVLANVDLLYFHAQSNTDNITLVWETETELDNLGFHLWRSQTAYQVDAVRITGALIPSQVGGQPIGALYEYPDNNVQVQVTYFYWLESVDMNGSSEFHGPVQGTLGGGNPISTQPPGGGGLPEPTRTAAPPPANTATPNLPAPAGSEPTATRPNPTPATAPVSAGATVAPTSISNNLQTSGNTPPTSTPPASITQPAESIISGDTGQPGAGQALPNTPAETPAAATNTLAVASNDPAPAPRLTATFIPGADLTAVGGHGAAADADGEASTQAGETQPGDNRQNSVAGVALVIGLLLTAVGGFALWSLGRRSA